MSLSLHKVLQVLAIGGLAALSLPGVQAARADTDLVPPVAQLFSWDAAAAPPSPAGPANCGANQAAVTQQADQRRRQAMARIAAVVETEPGGPAQPLNGRGYAYPVQRDPNAELRQVVLEAQRQRALRAATAP